MSIPVGINQIKSITLDPSILKTLHDTTCPICIEEFLGQQKIIQLTKCKHIFHNKCILAWLSKNNRTCPLCREVLRPTPDRVWVPVPQGFVPPSPLPNTPALRKLLKHENKTPTPLPNMRYGLSFHRQAEGTATVLSPIEMNYLKDFLSTAGYGDEECVRLLARACGPFSYCIKSCSSVLYL
uniref:RING-type domain-containing protein n=1 Tax=Tanacetum cinerariifolium TaxID=118510 RepID=A0A6L2J4B2_TANCI|nr:hypothetical protein [Tanacetum cinerariifolium]